MLLTELPTKLDWSGSVSRCEARNPVVYFVAILGLLVQVHMARFHGWYNRALTLTDRGYFVLSSTLPAKSQTPHSDSYSPYIDSQLQKSRHAIADPTNVSRKLPPSL